jgi:membrane AbrB-like protein
VIVGSAFGVALALERTALPSPALFAGLAVGIVVAVARPRQLSPPRWAVEGAFGVVGVVVGQLLSADVVRSVAADGATVLAAIVGTQLLAFGGGQLLARTKAADPATAVLGMVGGGATGVIAVSDEVGADARIVALMQYARVLVVQISIPIVVAVVGIQRAGIERAASSASNPFGAAAACALAIVVARAAASAVGMPSPALLGPMLLTGSIALVAPDLLPPIPEVLQSIAFGIIGLHVGLRFNSAELRRAAQLMPAVVVMVAALVAGCAALAGLLSRWSGRPYLECYLATSPGGMSAVFAVVVDAGADGGFVSAVQVMRVCVTVIAAPLLGWYIRRVRRAAS